MSTPINIGGTIINFPTSAESPNWSEPVVAFAEAVQNVLFGVSGPFDVPTQSFALDSFNPGTNISIPALIFSTASVRGAFIRYVVYRTTSLATAYEIGEMEIVYNPSNPTGHKWEVGRRTIGDGQISFVVTDTGQVQLSTIALSGINHVGKITFNAVALGQ
jgi:hypothetical protein